MSSTTSNYVYDQTTSTPAILTDGTWNYIYGPTGTGGQQLPIEMINGSTVYYLHHDIAGSTIVITNSSGATVNTLTYDPYGNLAGQTGTVTSPIGFEGSYQDASTGLDYMVNRYYDPTTAQFLTQDPLVATTGLPYQFAGNDPVNGSDPSGLCGCVSADIAVAEGLLTAPDLFFGATAPLLLLAPELLPIEILAMSATAWTGASAATTLINPDSTGADLTTTGVGVASSVSPIAGVGSSFASVANDGSDLGKISIPSYCRER